MEGKKRILRVYAIIIDSKKLCMVEKINAPNLFLPGGDMEGKEMKEDALRRILKNDLGINFKSAMEFKKYVQPDVFGDTQMDFYLMTVGGIEGTVKPKAGLKVHWVTSKDLLANKYKLPGIFRQEMLKDLVDKSLI
jgi:ADP-ribose pyrophosphatase YjhB (NUDIX family)